MPIKPPERCPACNSRSIAARGSRAKKLETVRLYRCRSCGRTFTPGPRALRNKTYPLHEILDALSTHNRGTSKEVLEQVREVVIVFPAERGLTLSPEKTSIVHVSEGFDFLGFNIRTYNGKLLPKPSKDAQSRMHRKVRNIISGNKPAEQRSLIKQLSPVISGWANYYRHCVVSRTFAKLDTVLWQALWQWAKRRHAIKGHRWIAKKYFRSFGTRNWVFAVSNGANHRGQTTWSKLAQATDTKICRHIMVRAALTHTIHSGTLTLKVDHG